MDFIKHEELKEKFFFESTIQEFTTEFELKFQDFFKTVIAPSKNNSKRFIYNSTIVSLYGYLENYLENIIEEYVSSIAQVCKNYQELPEDIKSKHLYLTLDLIKNEPKKKRYTHEELKKIEKVLISNLNSCVHELSPYNLNPRAFSQHTANFRYDVIHQFFAQVGVSNISRAALKQDYLIRSLCKKTGSDLNIESKLLISLLISELDDLAQRRNEISHGSQNSDLESFELFIERADFVLNFGRAIKDVLISHFNNFLYGISNKIHIGKPTRIYSNLNVFGFHTKLNDDKFQGLYIRQGMNIFAFNSNSKNKLFAGKIQSLVLNKTPVSQINFPITEEFAIKVDFDIYDRMVNRDIYLRVDCPS